MLSPFLGAFFCFGMKVSEFYTEIFIKYSSVTTDTRNISRNVLFFALRGEKFNGNDFAVEAIEKGAAFSIVDDSSIIHPQVIYVEHVLTFLQELSLYHRQQLDIPVIGITGTNGKTTTKELIASVLSQKYTVTCTQGNLNNHIGVPLTILSVHKLTDIAIIEMGANHVDEIAFLCSLVLPDYGIITNVGKAHLEGFGSFENVVKTKVALYESVKKRDGVIFVDADNDMLMSYAQNAHIVEYSLFPKTDVYGVLTKHAVSAGFTLYTNQGSVGIQSQLFGEYNIKNMLAACTIGVYFNVSLTEIANAIESYVPTNNRSQIVQTSSNTV
ncbi:MAG: UDP-N-acetylmuramoyl-tripeptide--D-alanyl-D-alanine ligase, partial [Bacteroidales bacterium]